jgi:hypothetical protein
VFEEWEAKRLDSGAEELLRIQRSLRTIPCFIRTSKKKMQEAKPDSQPNFAPNSTISTPLLFGAPVQIVVRA